MTMTYESELAALKGERNRDLRQARILYARGLTTSDMFERVVKGIQARYERDAKRLRIQYGIEEGQP